MPENTSRTVLIIEDDAFLRELAADKLRKEGYTVLEAITGEEGLEKLKELRPDLILLDLILPEMDGFEVLARIQKDEKTRPIPVMILSNFGQKADIEKGLRMGAKEYLIKAHVNPKEIVEKINALFADVK